MCEGRNKRDEVRGERVTKRGGGEREVRMKSRRDFFLNYCVFTFNRVTEFTKIFG